MDPIKKNVLIICASPKGKRGDNKQYTDYICEDFNHNFEILYPSVNLKKFADAAYLENFIQKIEKADAIIWITPVYVFHLPAQFLAVLNLLSESQKKFAIPSLIITTSIHLCENTAEEYFQDSLKRMGFIIHQSYSAFLANDLKSISKCMNLHKLISGFLKGTTPPKIADGHFLPIVPVEVNLPLTPQLEPIKVEGSVKKIVLVCDGEKSKSTELANRLSHYLGPQAEIKVHHLDDSIKIIPCCGALKCLMEDYCVFDDSDDYMKLYASIMEGTEAIIFASDVKYRFLSYNLKRFIDRSFRFLHKEQLENIYTGYLLHSDEAIPLELINYLKLFTKFQKGQMVGIVANTFFSESKQLDQALHQFALTLNHAIEEKILMPHGYENSGPWLVFKNNCPRFL